MIIAAAHAACTDSPPPAPATVLDEMVVAQLTNYGGSEQAGALSPDGQSVAFVSLHGGRPDIWIRPVAGGEPARLTDDAAREADLVFAPDGRSLYYSRFDRDGTSIWQVGVAGGAARRAVGGAQAPGVSPEGGRLSWFRPGRDGGAALSISSTDGTAPQTLVDGVFNADGPARADWSPDGRRLAYTSGAVAGPHNLILVDVGSGERQQVTSFTESGQGTRAQAWLPDGRHLAVTYHAAARADGLADLGVVDSHDGSIVRLSTNLERTVHTPSLSANGARLLLTATRHERDVWRVPFGPDPLANGLAATPVVGAEHDPYWIGGSRTGDTLFFTSARAGSRNVWAMPVDGRVPPRQVTQVAGDAVTQAALSPDGSRVAFVSLAGGHAEIWVQHVDGSGLRQLTREAAFASWPAWSPDGGTIAFASHNGRGWETRTIAVAGGTAEKLIDGWFRGDWARDPTGTGTLLVTATDGSGIRLLQAERRVVLWSDDREEAACAAPLFSPDARTISVVHCEGRDRSAIWVYDVASGASRAAVRFAPPFTLAFRAVWIDQGRGFLVNRTQATSHVVLFDRFSTTEPSSGR